jgi:hypothetical protein
MSDEEELTPGPPAPNQVDGVNIPNAVEELLAKVAALEAWRADIEARIDQLAGGS